MLKNPALDPQFALSFGDARTISLSMSFDFPNPVFANREACIGKKARLWLSKAFLHQQPKHPLDAACLLRNASNESLFNCSRAVSHFM